MILRARQASFAAARKAVIRGLGFVLSLLCCLQQGSAQASGHGEIRPVIDTVDVKYERADPAPRLAGTTDEDHERILAAGPADASAAGEDPGTESDEGVPTLKLLLTLSLIIITIFMARSTLKEQGVPSMTRVSALMLGGMRPGDHRRPSIMQSGIQRLKKTFSGKDDKRS